MSIVHCKLALQFDPERLRADVGAIDAGEWLAHYNASDHEGPWTGVALRAVAGGHNPLYADPVAQSRYADTGVLDRCPYLREVLAAFQCPLRSARLLKLGPGARIREHRDAHLGLEEGEARIHIPVATNPGVEFVVNGEQLVMNEGDCWYLDLSRPHRVKNVGVTDRVHLVIDCELNDWLRELIEAGTIVPAQEHPLPRPNGQERGGLAEFQAAVLNDAALQERLRETEDHELFVACVVRLGRALGYDFSAGDVEDALRARRRAWIERNTR